MMRAASDLFRWIPGNGCSTEALARLRSAFPRPPKPMGEAWFMGADRRMFAELQRDLQTLAVTELERPLEEIAAGTGSFGHNEEWAQWCHYLLAQLTPRGHERGAHALVELLVTGFISQYPDGISSEPYRGFRHDVLDTLGRCLMDTVCWPSGMLDIGMCLDKRYHPSTGMWRWFDAGGKLSCLMFFCLKYLDVAAIRPWLTSVLSIDDPHWRAQIMVWFVGADDMLSGRIRHPSELPESGYPQIDWNGSRYLSGSFGSSVATNAFIHAANRAEAVDTVRSFMTEATFLAWLQSICAHDELEAELADLPFQFHALYGAGRDGAASG